MYFSFSKLKKWGKKTAAARRHNCAVLPYVLPKSSHSVNSQFLHISPRLFVGNAKHSLYGSVIKRKAP